MRSDALTLAEQQVMLAILRRRPSAYGVSIREEIESKTGKAPSIAAIYAILERLDERGFLTSRQGEATASRGGRRKLFFDLNVEGSRALSDSLRSIDQLRPAVLGGALA